MVDPRLHITAPMREADAEVRNVLARARRSLDAVRGIDNDVDNQAWRDQQALLSRAVRTWELFMRREGIGLLPLPPAHVAEKPAPAKPARRNGVSAESLTPKVRDEIAGHDAAKRWS